MTTASNNFGRSGSISRRSAFTLNELLIVIGIAVLIMGMAVAAFNAISGGRSIEGSENQISSYLSATRADAIGLQEPRGVIFFEDAGTGRVTLAQVYYPPSKTRPEMDLLGTNDEMALPAGIGIKGVNNGNTADLSIWNNYALILFDGNGKLIQDGVRVDAGSSLFERLPVEVQNKLKPALSANAVPPADQTGNIGFVLYDKPGFDAQQDATARKSWLDENAIPFLVNRYNGSLMRGE